MAGAPDASVRARALLFNGDNSGDPTFGRPGAGSALMVANREVSFGRFGVLGAITLDGRGRMITVFCAWNMPAEASTTSAVELSEFEPESDEASAEVSENLLSSFTSPT